VKKLILFATMISMSAIVLLAGCSGSSTSTPPETPDSTFFISAFIFPVTFPESPLTETASITYCARVSLNNTDGTTIGAKVTDAAVTVNGESIPYTSFLGQYYGVLDGSYGTGSVITVTIVHPRIGMMIREITIPAANVPASFTISPSFSSGTSVYPPYAVYPASSWMKFGSIAAILYDSQKNVQGVSYFTSISGTGGATFTNQNLTYGGSTGTLAAYVQFAAYSMDKFDLDAYGFVGSTPSRIRVFAPNGSSIGSNL
jgi:hypothetical protein